MLELLVAEIKAHTATPEGVRSAETLNRARYTAGGLAAAGHLSEDEAQIRLTEVANIVRPRQARRNAHIVVNSLAAGARRPLHLEGCQ